MKLLHIDSSIQGEGSASRELTREIVARWKAERPDTQVTYLNLAAQELPHLSQKSLSAPMSSRRRAMPRRWSSSSRPRRS